MCRSALEFPPNGKRCGLGEHFTEQQREEKRLKRNAREKELYYLRKQKRKTINTPNHPLTPVELTNDTFNKIIDNYDKGDAETVPELFSTSNKTVITQYEKPYSSLVSLSQNEKVLGAENPIDPQISTPLSRAITAKILSEVQDDIAYQTIIGKDEKFYSNSTNEVQRLTLDDGSIGYFKNYKSSSGDPETHNDYGHDVLETFNNEVVSYRLCEIMGEGYNDLVPVTVFREYEGNIGTFQLEARGKVGWRKEWKMSRRENGETFNLDQLRRIALFDYLAGSQDRHNENYSVIDLGSEGKDKLVLIDNGFSFPSEDNSLGNELLPSEAAIDRHDGNIILSDKEKNIINKVKKSLDDGELSGLLSTNQKTFMRKRIDYLLEENNLSLDTMRAFMSF